MQEDFGYAGQGSQSVYIELRASEMYYINDKIVIYFDLMLPERELEDGKLVYQYIQMRSEAMPEGEYISAGCMLEVGASNSTRVANFYGESRLNDQNYYKGKTVDELGDDKDTEQIFKKITDGYYWGEVAWHDEFRGTKGVTCMM